MPALDAWPSSNPNDFQDDLRRLYSEECLTGVTEQETQRDPLGAARNATSRRRQYRFPSVARFPWRYSDTAAVQTVARELALGVLRGFQN